MRKTTITSLTAAALATVILAGAQSGHVAKADVQLTANTDQTVKSAENQPSENTSINADQAQKDVDAAQEKANQTELDYRSANGSLFNQQNEVNQRQTDVNNKQTIADHANKNLENAKKIVQDAQKTHLDKDALKKEQTQKEQDLKSAQVANQKAIADYKNIGDQINKIEDETKDVYAIINDLNIDIKLSKRIVDGENLQEYIEKYNSLKSQVQNMEQNINNQKDKIDKARQNYVDKDIASRKAQPSQFAQAEAELEAAKNDYEQAVASLTGLKSQLINLKREFHNAESDDISIDGVSKEEAKENIQDYKNNLESRKQQLQSLGDQKENLREQAKEKAPALLQKIKETSQDIANKQAALDEVNSKIKAADNLQKFLQDLQSDADNANKNLAVAQEALKSAQARLAKDQKNAAEKSALNDQAQLELAQAQEILDAVKAKGANASLDQKEIDISKAKGAVKFAQDRVKNAQILFKIAKNDVEQFKISQDDVNDPATRAIIYAHLADQKHEVDLDNVNYANIKNQYDEASDKVAKASDDFEKALKSNQNVDQAQNALNDALLAYYKAEEAFQDAGSENWAANEQYKEALASYDVSPEAEKALNDKYQQAQADLDQANKVLAEKQADLQKLLPQTTPSSQTSTTTPTTDTPVAPTTTPTTTPATQGKTETKPNTDKDINKDNNKNTDTSKKNGQKPVIKNLNRAKSYRLTHNAFVYDRRGHVVRRGLKISLLRRGRRIKARRIVKIHGIKFYQIGRNQFVKVINTQVHARKLNVRATIKARRNARVRIYNEKGRFIKRYVLGRHAYHFNEKRRIHGKTYYKIAGKNQWVLASKLAIKH